MDAILPTALVLENQDDKYPWNFSELPIYFGAYKYLIRFCMLKYMR